MKALDNRFYVKLMQFEIGLLAYIKTTFLSILQVKFILIFSGGGGWHCRTFCFLGPMAKITTKYSVKQGVKISKKSTNILMLSKMSFFTIANHNFQRSQPFSF